MPDVISDPFHRALASLIEEEIEIRKEALASGAATRISEDTTSVAEKYAAAVSYIHGLRVALELCQQIEVNQGVFSPRPAQVKVTER